MFPTPGDEIYRNDAGEVTGWSRPAVADDYYCDVCGFNHTGDCAEDYDGEDDDDNPKCELCGEPIPTDEYGFYLVEVGEFWDAKNHDGILAHAQCGLDAELPLA